MAVEEAAGLDVGNLRQLALGDVMIKINCVLEMLRLDRRIGHNRRLVEERIADVALGTGVGTCDEAVPAFTVIFPRDSFFEQSVGDRPHRRRGMVKGFSVWRLPSPL